VFKLNIFIFGMQTNIYGTLHANKEEEEEVERSTLLFLQINMAFLHLCLILLLVVSQ